MRIQTKLLVLTGFWTVALLLNLMALGYLARLVPQVLRQAETVTIRQQRAALSMRAELRDAEAALYRYLMEGEKGFIEQFHQHLAGFEESLQVYESLGGENEQVWVDALRDDFENARAVGQELILLRDRQQEDFESIEKTNFAAMTLLKQIVNRSRQRGPAYQQAAHEMQVSLQEMQLAVTAYMSSPNAEERVRFTEAAVDFYQAKQRFKALAQTSLEKQWARTIEDDFSEIQGLGLRLINGRDQQMSLFARFAAILFAMGQETLERKVQPASEQKLTLAWNQMLMNVRALGFSSILIAALTWVIAIGVTVPLVRQINQGIQALLAGADRVAAGELTQPVEVQGSKELEKLADTFNNMMVDLAARERRLKARLSELEGLRQVSLELTGTSEPEKVFHVIAESALKLANACEVHIFILEKKTSNLRFAASAWRDSENRPRPRPPRPDGLVMQAALSKQVIVVNHAQDHPLFSEGEAQRWGIRAAAALPLQSNNRVVGVLNVIVRTRSVIGEDELRILALLADQAAVAIESADLYAALADREARLHELVQKMAHIQEEERRLIGLDLHDGLTQLLISANMHFNTLEAFSEGLSEAARMELALGHARLKAAIDEARRVIAELRPAALETMGLVSGLRQYATTLSQAEGWQLEYVVHVADEIVIPPDIETAVFRIAQEALSNARKHAQTNYIRLSLRSEGHDLILEVEDRGVGFDIGKFKDEKDRLGLVGMRERTALLGGLFEIQSTPDIGTLIRVRIPLPSPVSAT